MRNRQAIAVFAAGSPVSLATVIGATGGGIDLARTPHFSRELAEVRRTALVEAALESLAARGLGAVSVRDVAARAGVSPGLLRHHFGGFANLLAEAYRATVARVEANIDEAVAAAGDDPAKRMRAFLEASFQPTIVDRDLLSAWLGFWGLVRSDAAAAAVHAETFRAYRGRIEVLLSDLARSRDAAVDARLGAIGLSAMLDGMWLELCLDPSTFTPAEAVEIAAAWVDGWLGRKG
jgi:TetR/AcrR family transcriptional repressor of bet genes